MNSLDQKRTLLISPEKIQKRVLEMGKEISENYTDKDPIFIGVLNGSFMFMADLLRSIPLIVKWILLRFVVMWEKSHLEQFNS
jgi:hypoxanthine-guanine phosphoribosyltransferase